MSKYQLTIQADSAEELADIAAALENLAAQRVRRAADSGVVAEILAGAELDAEVASFEDEVAELSRANPGPGELAKAAAVLRLPDGPMRDPFAAPAEFSQGLYRAQGTRRDRPESVLYYVYRAQAGTHWLAKGVTPAKDGEPIRFDYAGAAERFVRPDQRCSDDEHIAFGQVTHWCGFCGTKLTDGELKTLGYGPVCAGKHGLPHSGAR